MRRTLPILLSAHLLLSTSLLTAQTYWGMTSTGGTSDIGTIYSITETGTFTKKHDFFRVSGGGPKCDLIQAGNGRLYGVTEFGGTNGVGTLFEFNPTTGVFTTLASFSNTLGEQPVRGLVQHTNGRLYGTCSAGGANGFGTIFEYNISTTAFNKRHDFENVGANLNGRSPRSGLVQAANGQLYGTTLLGGANNQGIIYEFQPTGNNFVKRADLTLANGARPFAGLMRASNNLLYGTTTQGGANGEGVIFSFNSTTFAYTVLFNLSSADGSVPYAELMQNGTGGLLYGTTSEGGANGQGVIFSFDLTGNLYARLVDLSPALGYRPLGRLRRAANGLLYGTTSLGGTSSLGVLFSYDPATSTYTLLKNLSEIGTSGSWSGVFESPTGTLNGVASTGGDGGSGTLFRYGVAGNTLTEAVSFAFSNGSQPKGRLVRDANGKFYGLTSAGGANGSGICFSFDPTTNTFTRLVNLSSTTGTFPTGSLTLANGKYYGLCNLGGTSNEGTLIEFDPVTSVLTAKVNFAGATGTLPRAGLLLASNGLLYGSTTAGGANGFGTLFSYSPGANSVTPLVDLSLTTGIQPFADLIQASNGLLYGTLSEEGAFDNGSLFSFNTSTNTFTKLYDFDGLQGGNPAGRLVQASNGVLYGMCREDGLYFNGTLYSWNITTGTYTQLYDMATTEGSASESNMIQGTDGNLYGVCVQGGTNGLGTIFRYNPTNNSFTVVRSMAVADGTLPFDGLVPEAIPTPPTGVGLSMKVFLEGPYNTGTGLMNDALRLQASFPLTEPFTALGFTHVGGGGGETIAPAVLTVTGSNAITDWILVELRSKTNSATVLHTRSALVQRDGDVVGLDGTSALTVNAPADEYYVAVRHRNHLACMTLNSVNLGAAPTAINFTDGTVATFGTNAQKVNGSVRLLWAGNVVRDTQLKYAGGSNDRDPILVRIGGTVPTATVTGYWSEDVNMDATVKYAGGANDRDPILVNVGGTVPTATRTQQLP